MKNLPEQVKHEIEVVSKVLPFKTNNYMIDYLIDWENFETDPVFILNFPSRNMLHEEQFKEVEKAYTDQLPEKEFLRIVNKIRLQLNPHPANQMSNVPKLDGDALPGVQYKYRDDEIDSCI